MKIKQILTQHRRDFTAVMECEHCGHESKLMHGYDSDDFHRNVIPDMDCKECGEKAPDSYRPLATKYPPGMEV